MDSINLFEKIKPEYEGLSIRFGKFDDDIFFVDDVFDSFDFREWLEDDYVQAIIKDIEKCDIVNPMTYTNQFGVFGPTDLATGTKALILMYKMDSLIIDATRCGDNCAKWIIDIAKIHPVTITLRYIMELSMIGDFYSINSGKVCNGYKEYLHEYMEWFKLEE